MCWRLEFDRRTQKAKKRITCGRLTLNIVGLLLILVLGAIAAVFATYSADWFPEKIGNDGIYASIAENDHRVILLTEENLDECSTDSSSDPTKMVGRYVFRCGGTNISQCLPMSLRCDGYDDCDDNNSDEVGCGEFCAKGVSRGVRFECKRSNDDDLQQSPCINSDYKCNGKVDCTEEDETNNDESSCDYFKVLAGGIQCSEENSVVCKDNTRCIRPLDLCNGVENCYDGSDEKNCAP